MTLSLTSYSSPLELIRTGISECLGRQDLCFILSRMKRRNKIKSDINQGLPKDGDVKYHTVNVLL